MPVTIRPAEAQDIPKIWEIFNHYVMNTSVSFLVKSPTQSYIQSRYQASKDQGLPYLIAVESDKIVGYTYASGYRGFMIGYISTVEITIFCHPDHRGKGIGKLLIGELLDKLKGTIHITREACHESEAHEAEIKQVLAVMSLDEEKGHGLRNWYQGWGFEEVGRLRKVGFKKGRW